MRYKTIILELLKDQFPVLYDRLCRERMLLSSLDRYAMDLKDAHVAWMRELRQANPRRSLDQIAVEALELAVEHIQGLLPFESPPEETGEALHLDEAMAFIRTHTRTA
jgi:hypothetical protein